MFYLTSFLFRVILFSMIGIILYLITAALWGLYTSCVGKENESPIHPLGIFLFNFILCPITLFLTICIMKVEEFEAYPYHEDYWHD